RLLVADGTGGQPPSLNATLGAPVPMPGWVFADGPALEPGVQTDYVVYNPGNDAVDVDITVQPDAQALAAEAIPFAVNVRPGQFADVAVGKDSRVPNHSGY